MSSEHNVVVFPCRADLTTAEGAQTIISTCKEQTAGRLQRESDKFQVDILVHSAALFHGAPLEACTLDDFQKVYAINVWGPINLTQAVKPYLPTDRSGRIVSPPLSPLMWHYHIPHVAILPILSSGRIQTIYEPHPAQGSRFTNIPTNQHTVQVNISSIGSKVGLQYLTLYGGSKGALEAMTRTWARELAESATVNCISPGSTMTDMYRDAPHAAKAAMALHNPLTPLSPLREWDTPEQRELGEAYGGRVAYPEEIAGIVGMICSPESGWMTGCLVSANGGQWMSS